jgi:Icc-related predicted phosphoesterase
MSLLAFGDPHIKPADNPVDYDKLIVPSDVDAIVTIGDVVHSSGKDDLRAGRKFFEQLAEFDLPVICVPGDHDPQENYKELIGGLPSVLNAHKHVVTENSFRDSCSSGLADHQVIGWGCEEPEFEPEIRLVDFPSLDPRSAPRRERRHAADDASQRLEDALFESVSKSLDRSQLIEELGVQEDGWAEFAEQHERTLEVYSIVDDLLEQAADPTIVLTHIPPYNTELDRHHSVGEREIDLEGLHVGSIGLKLALRKHNPLAALSGHSHNGKYEPGIGSAGRPHMLNLDFRGIATVNVDAENGSFGYSFHHTDN